MTMLPLEAVLSENLARIGHRIKVIRAGKGWSQSELAARLGRTQTAVSYWESGRRAPGVDDLVEVAEVLGVSPAELLPSASQRRPVSALLRAVAEDVDAHQLADQLEKFAMEIENIPSPEVSWSVNPSSPQNTAEALLGLATVKNPPIPVVELAEGCGVKVLEWDFDNVDGLIIQPESGPAIGYNRRQSETRQKFTIAHELGHYLLRHGERFHLDFGGELSPAATGEHPAYNWRDERAANDFAANLLMPATHLRAAFRMNSHVKILASKFNVSPAAMGFRIKNLGLD